MPVRRIGRAERLAGLPLGAHGPVAAYDGDLLPRALAYDGVGIEGALWSLPRAANDWNEALGLAVEKGVVMIPRNEPSNRCSMSRAPTPRRLSPRVGHPAVIEWTGRGPRHREADAAAWTLRGAEADPG